MELLRGRRESLGTRLEQANHQLTHVHVLKGTDGVCCQSSPREGGGGKNTTETDELWLTSPVIVINAWKLEMSGHK